MAGNKVFHMKEAYDTEADRKAAEDAERQRRMEERARDLDRVPLPTKDIRHAKDVLRDRRSQLKKLEEENGI